jgi:hypothetical protein
MLRSGIEVETYVTLVEAGLLTLDNFSSINRSFAGIHAGMIWLKKCADYNDSSFKILKKLNQHQIMYEVVVCYTNMEKRI